MKPSIRISIAFVLGSLISKSTFSHIMADSENQYLKITSKFSRTDIDVEECETGNSYYGMIQGDQGTFHHSGENATITFKLNGFKFNGLDSQSGKNFNGSFSDNIVKLFDYEEGKYFSYHLL